MYWRMKEDRHDPKSLMWADKPLLRIFFTSSLIFFSEKCASMITLSKPWPYILVQVGILTENT